MCLKTVCTRAVPTRSNGTKAVLSGYTGITSKEDKMEKCYFHEKCACEGTTLCLGLRDVSCLVPLPDTKYDSTSELCKLCDGKCCSEGCGSHYEGPNIVRARAMGYEPNPEGRRRSRCRLSSPSGCLCPRVYRNAICREYLCIPARKYNETPVPCVADGRVVLHTNHTDTLGVYVCVDCDSCPDAMHCPQPFRGYRVKPNGKRIKTGR